MNWEKHMKILMLEDTTIKEKKVFIIDLLNEISQFFDKKDTLIKGLKKKYNLKLKKEVIEEILTDLNGIAYRVNPKNWIANIIYYKIDWNQGIITKVNWETAHIKWFRWSNHNINIVNEIWKEKNPEKVKAQRANKYIIKPREPINKGKPWMVVDELIDIETKF